MKRVRTGMTCLGVALLLVFALCLSNPSAQPRRGTGLKPGDLPDSLRGMEIKERFLPSSHQRVGVIHALVGNTVVVHRSTNEAYWGQAGDPVYEDDSLNVLADSRCRVRFLNDDVVSMGSETVFAVDKYLDQKEEKAKSSMFSLLKGKAMFYAMRLFGYKNVNVQVKTPTAVLGVRGTKFGVHVYRLDDKIGLSPKGKGPILVADSGKEIGPYLAQTGPGADGQIVTEVGSADGTVFVNGETVGPGEVYNTYTGEKVYDPGFITVLESDTGGAPGAGQPEEGDQTGTDSGAGLGDQADLAENQTDTSQQQTGQKTEGSAAAPPTVTLYKYGYFSSLLINEYESIWVRDVFVSQAPNPFVDETTRVPITDHRADSIIENDYVIWSDNAFKTVTTDGEGASPIPIHITTATTVVSSTYDYLTYGSWTHTGSFMAEWGVDTFLDHSWWLEGYASPVDVIAARKGSIGYEGEAHGTMWDSWTEAQLSGSFSATANFDNAQIENFSLDVTGASGRYARISGAEGPIHEDGTFNISGGTWSLKGSTAYCGIAQTPVYKAAHGRFFGPGAEETGGAWGMYRSSGLSAAGVFAGKENVQP